MNEFLLNVDYLLQFFKDEIHLEEFIITESTVILCLENNKEYVELELCKNTDMYTLRSNDYYSKYPLSFNNECIIDMIKRIKTI